MEMEVTSLELNPATFKYILEDIEDVCICIAFKKSIHHVVVPGNKIQRKIMLDKIEQAFKERGV